MEDLRTWSELVKNCAEALAVLVGGAWAFWMFVLKRERETALEIDLNMRCIPAMDGFLSNFDVKLTNKAKVRVTAKPARLPAYRDRSERLKFSVSLLVRKLDVGPPADPPDPITWFTNSSSQSPVTSDAEVDLLSDYEIGGRTDFWMEPGENYHVGAALVLKPGIYLAMVTFVGSRRDEEFWRRVVLLQVPEDGLPKAPGAELPANTALSSSAEKREN